MESYKVITFRNYKLSDPKASKKCTCRFAISWVVHIPPLSDEQSIVVLSAVTVMDTATPGIDTGVIGDEVLVTVIGILRCQVARISI